MTKKKLRLLSVTLLSLMAIIIAYFCIFAMPTQEASADEKEVLTDVEYLEYKAGRDRSISSVFFIGSSSSPTVGTYFAYGRNVLFKGYRLPSYQIWKTIDYSKLKVFDYLGNSFYILTFSFDFLGSGVVNPNYIVNGESYSLLGTFYFKKDGISFWLELSFLRNAQGEYFMYDNQTNYFSYLEDFSGSEGEFIHLTYAIPIDANLTEVSINMPCSLNAYCSMNLGFQIENLENQAFLDTYTYQSLIKELYLLDNTFAYLENVTFNGEIGSIFEANYNIGYNQGYDVGYKVGLKGVDTIGGSTWLSSLFSSVTKLFNINLFGGITLATVIFIPLILGILLFILKLVRG